MVNAPVDVLCQQIVGMAMTACGRPELPSTSSGARRPIARSRGAISRTVSITFPAGAATARPGCPRACAGRVGASR